MRRSAMGAGGRGASRSGLTDPAGGDAGAPRLLLQVLKRLPGAVELGPGRGQRFVHLLLLGAETEDLVGVRREEDPVREPGELLLELGHLVFSRGDPTSRGHAALPPPRLLVQSPLLLGVELARRRLGAGGRRRSGALPSLLLLALRRWRGRRQVLVRVDVRGGRRPWRSRPDGDHGLGARRGRNACRRPGRALLAEGFGRRLRW